MNQLYLYHLNIFHAIKIILSCDRLRDQGLHDVWRWPGNTRQDIYYLTFIFGDLNKWETRLIVPNH